MKNSRSVGRPISGSKPRKFVTQNRPNNPSLVSMSVTALFANGFLNPQRKNQPSSRLANPNVLSSSGARYDDSLSRAQIQFSRRKQESEKVPVSVPQNNDSNISMSRRNSSPFLGTAQQLNYMKGDTIKTKQRHGYNIINCYPVS